MNDLPFLSNITHDGSPYYLNPLDAEFNTLNTTWEVINVADIKQYPTGASAPFSSILPTITSSTAKTLTSGNNNNATTASSGGSQLSNSSLSPLMRSGVLHSTAVDHRLQTSPELLPELRLAMLNATHTSSLHAAVTAPLLVRALRHTSTNAIYV